MVSLWAGAGTALGWPPPGDAGLVAPSEEALCAAESADHSRAAWARVPLCR